MIGVLTAFIGDLASAFGCTVGLKDSITAISFVALGTSVPGNTTASHSVKTSPKDNFKTKTLFQAWVTTLKRIL